MMDSELNNIKASIPDPIPSVNESIGETWVEGSEEISLKQIAFIRAINDLDSVIINEEKEVILPSLATRTKGGIPRLTTHTAINHLVTSHMWGDWSAPELIVIMPGVDTVQENGLPQNLRHQDSFWYKDLKVPKNSVLIWRDVIPPEFKNSEYKNIEVKLDKKILEKIENLNMESKKAKNREEIIRISDQKYSLKRDLEDYFQQIVSKQLKEMNYSHLPKENGTYSHHKNLDHSIHNLAKVLGVNTSYIHSETPSYMFEQLHLLDRYYQDPKNVKPLTINDIRDDLYHYDFMKDITTFAGGDYDMIRIFTSELSNWMSANLKSIEDDESIKDSFHIFFNNNPFVKELLREFSAKNGKLEELIDSL